METNLFSLLSKKVITTVITLGSMFYSAIDGVNANFDDIQLKIRGENIIVTTQLVNCFTEELDQIFQSGEKINIHFQIDLYESGKSVPIQEETFFHTISFSFIDNIFNVYQSENLKTFGNLDIYQAKTALTRIDNFSLISSLNLTQGHTYFIKITAWMDIIQIQGMDEPLNLMFYWNSLKPEKDSVPFNLESFKQ